MVRTEEIWLSCYVYHAGTPGDVVLERHIAPVIKHALAKRWSSHFFFIRYTDEKGMHIRLRLRGEEQGLQTKLKPYITSMLDAYTVEFVPYVPELDRYGGFAGVVIAEQQFEASSRAVLAVLSESVDWIYGRAIGAALQLHLGLVHAAGMGRKDALELFSHIASHGEAGAHAKPFGAEAATLLPYLGAVWDALGRQGAVFKEGWFNTWLADMRSFSTTLSAAHMNYTLQLPSAAEHEIGQLLVLYESYIHMTNNRLGIATADEPDVAYMLMRALDRCMV